MDHRGPNLPDEPPQLPRQTRIIGARVQTMNRDRSGKLIGNGSLSRQADDRVPEACAFRRPDQSCQREFHSPRRQAGHNVQHVYRFALAGVQGSAHERFPLPCFRRMHEDS